MKSFSFLYGFGKTPLNHLNLCYLHLNYKGPFVFCHGFVRAANLEFSMATEFLRAGCNVTLSSRGEAIAASIRKELSPFEGKYIYVPCDIREKENLQKLWDTSLARWGGIDIWINKAGKNTPHLFSWETSETDTENIINTNLAGMIYGSQIAATGMLKQGHGAIYRRV